MHSLEQMTERYYLNPDEDVNDLPAHFHENIAPNVVLEKTIYVFKDKAGEARFHVIQMHEVPDAK